MRNLIATLMCVCVLTLSAQATSFIIPSDAELVRRAAVIARGEVVGIADYEDPQDGRAYRLVTINPNLIIKGQLATTTFTLRELRNVAGAAEFMPGERVLIFAEMDNGGWLRLLGMAATKFNITDAGQLKRAVIPRGAILRQDLSATASGDASAFVARLRKLAAVKTAKGQGDLLAPHTPDDLRGLAIDRFTFLNYTDYRPTHKCEMYNGAPYVIHLNLGNAAHFSPDIVTTLGYAITAWESAAGASINLEYGGATTQCSQFSSNPPVTLIGFDNCDGFYTPNSTIAGITFGGYTPSGFGLLVNGSIVDPVSNMDTMLNPYLPAAQFTCDYAYLIGHELGHVLGLDHSQYPGGGTYGMDCTARPFDEQDGVAYVYPTTPTTFNDISGHAAALPIIRMGARKMTSGCGGGSFCPDSSVTREQMAVFLSRAVLGPRHLLTYSQNPVFADVPFGHPFRAQIEEMASLQITAGCDAGPPRLYCPTANVTREQMAAFIIRALNAPGYVPPTPSSQRFADVPPSNPFYDYIEEMAARGITTGCGGGNYCPADNVTRAQMAIFLGRAFKWN